MIQIVTNASVGVLVFLGVFTQSLFAGLPSETKVGYYSEFLGLKEKSSAESFKPASTSKLFTAYTALKKLGPDFRFKTTAQWYHSKTDPTAVSQITLIGDGDPTFGVSDYGEVVPGARLKAFAQNLKASGITSVKSPLIFIPRNPDLNRRGSFTLPTGWTEEDYRYCFGLSAIPSAFNFRENCGLYSVTGLTSGTWDLPTLRKVIPSELHYGHQNSISLEWDPILKINKLHGTYVRGSRPAFIPVPLTEGDALSIIENEFKIALNEVGIRYSANQPLNDFQILRSTIFYSLPLVDILKPFLKYSLNYVGEHLILALGESVLPNGRSTYDRGQALVQESLLSFSEMKPGEEIAYDGCGLSRLSRVAPKTLWNLLSEIHNDPTTFSVFLDFLPISGVDGTLKERLKGPGLLGKIHAKTGSLDGVSNLAGFIQSGSDQKPQWDPFVVFNQSATITSPRQEVDLLVRKWTGVALRIDETPETAQSLIVDELRFWQK